MIAQIQRLRELVFLFSGFVTLLMQLKYMNESLVVVLLLKIFTYIYITATLIKVQSSIMKRCFKKNNLLFLIFVDMYISSKQ